MRLSQFYNVNRTVCFTKSRMKCERHIGRGCLETKIKVYKFSSKLIYLEIVSYCLLINIDNRKTK